MNCGASLCSADGHASPTIPLGLPTSRRQSSKHWQAKPPDIFGRWLKDRLDEERESIVTQLQELVVRHVGEHHRAVVEDLETYLAKLPPPPLPLGSLPIRRGSSALLRPPAGEELQPPVRAPQPHCLSPPRRPSATSCATRSTHGAEEHAAEQSTVDKITSAHSRITEILEPMPSRGKSKWAPDFHSSEMPTTRISWLVRSGLFEVFFCWCILGSVVLLSFEAQYMGLGLGYDMDLDHYIQPADVVWPHAKAIFDTLSLAFVCVFALEFVLRIGDAGKRSVFLFWTWFDVAVLIIGIVDGIVRLGGSIDIGLKPNVLRVARVGRFVRVLKFLRYQEHFQSLFLLIKSLQVSARALWWSCTMMFGTMMIVGMLINQSLYTYMNDSSVPVQEREEVFTFWGTYTRMVLTMFEITLGNWTPPKRILVENVGEGWGFVIVLYRCIVCYALVNITGAVFVTETTRAAAADNEVALMNKERTTKSTMRKLEELFIELDTTGDGVITAEEFRYLMFDESMKNFLGTLQMDVDDAAECFALLDDGDGRVMRDEFIHGIMAMRGQAKSVDMILLLKMTRLMDAKIDKLVGNRASGARRGSVWGAKCLQ